MYIRRELALPQHRPYPVNPDKGADSGGTSGITRPHNPLLESRRYERVKRKERPPKDSRPKEKRFRHGGRKGRRAAQLREERKRR